MNVSRRKTAIIFPFRMFLEQKNISVNSIQSAEFDEIKNLPKTEKIAEVFFLRLRFHFLRLSELEMRANKQF